MDTMRSDHETVQPFNLETMSGVFPGTRTQIFQRLRLRSIAGDKGEMTWSQFLWFAQPPVAVLVRTIKEGTQLSDAPILELIQPLQGNFLHRLEEAARSRGWQLEICGSCDAWQSLAERNPDGVPTGLCGWRSQQDNALDLPVNLAVQSCLSLACAHWRQRSANLSEPIRQNQTAGISVTSADVALPKAAELDRERPNFWQRMRQRLVSAFSRQSNGPDGHKGLLERSGVGAGTEPCFVCQGRIANLGAIAVETLEGDKQTYSVWRCRACYTLYLNNWVDRWERLDNLETEESYYRIAPADAQVLLGVIASAVGGDHPGRRKDRQTQRMRIEHIISGLKPLSHQVKQGR